MTGPARGIALVALVTGTVLAVVTTREWGIGREEVVASDAAASQGDFSEAITHARAAAEALAPGSPWPARGWLRLEAVGRDAETRGDDATALAAYGAMRAAALATRGLGSGSGPWEAKADEGLARVAASQRDLGPHVSPESVLEALNAGETPSVGRLVALSVSSVAILGGLAWLVFLGDGRSGARVAKVAVAAGFALYAGALLTS